MIVEYAKTLPLPVILNKIGLQPKQENNIPFLYSSPFHTGTALTLHVNPGDNTWYDTKMSIGGNQLDFVQEYLKHHNERCSMVDVLNWLKANIGYPSLFSLIELKDYASVDKKYTFSFKSLLLNNTLISYIETRCIPLGLARKHLKEVAIINENNGKEFYAVGLRNEDGGFAFRTPSTKGMVGLRAVSFIRSQNNNYRAIHIFKDIFDYLSAITILKGKSFNGDVIILNSYSCLEDSAKYVRQSDYKKVYTWFDNGTIGKQATKNYAFLCQTQNDMLHKPMNYLYASRYDLNGWFMKLAEEVNRHVN